MNNSELWSMYKENPTAVIKRQIMINYTNLVHYVIHNSKFVTLSVIDEKDFFQFGIEGLSEAIERFDPQYGTKFETYAIQRIRGKIIDEIRKIQSKPRTNGNSDADYSPKNISLSYQIDGVQPRWKALYRGDDEMGHKLMGLVTDFLNDKKTKAKIAKMLNDETEYERKIDALAEKLQADGYNASYGTCRHKARELVDLSLRYIK